jgi:zinc protease
MIPHIVRQLRTIACAIPVLASAVAAQETRLGRLIQRDTLPNGLTVIVLENHAVPLATAHIVFRGGAIMQTPELQGVPHLFEHMLFKSYLGGNGQSFGAAASESRASYNGATSDEDVSYTLWFPSNQRDANIELLADLVRDPIFKNPQLQSERFVVRNEMQRSESEPTWLLQNAARRALWGDWFYRKNTIGDQLSLLSTQLITLKSIYDTWYVPNNAALVVTGDVKPADVFGAARRHFGRWKRKPDPLQANPVPTAPPFDSSFAFVLTHEVQTVTIRMIWRGPTLRANAGDTDDASTLASMLSAETSRFQRALTDGGLFQRVSLDADINRYGSELTFVGTTTMDRLLPGLGALGNELQFLGNSAYYDGLDFRAAAQRQRVNTALAMEQSAAFASVIGSLWAAGTLRDSAATLRDTSATTRSERLSAFATKYMVKKPYVIGALVPLGAQNDAQAALAQFVSFMKEP